VVQQFERVLLAAGFVEQDGQAAIALGVVGITLEALVIEVLGLLQVAWAVVEGACFMERGGQVVVAFGRFRVLRDRLLETVGGLLVVALLVEADAFDVRRLRLDIAAAGGGDEAQRDRGEDAAGGRQAVAIQAFRCGLCGSHFLHGIGSGKRVCGRLGASGEKVAEVINARKALQGGFGRA
jgi:hypothetical protein